MRSLPSARRHSRLVPGLVATSVVALAATAFAVLGPPTDDRAARRAPPPTVPALGVMAWQANRLEPADFALLRGGGVRYSRFNLLTSRSDDRGQRLPVGEYDRLIRAAATQGIESLPVLLRSRPEIPPRKPGQTAEPPETPREYRLWRQRVRFYAERYGPHGRFWRENPELSYQPLRVWEVWNEPNLTRFWDRRRIDPGEYARLLRETRAVLRDVDPQARIVSGGVASRYRGARYLDAVLAAAGSCSVDAISVHPYAPSTERAMRHLAVTRRAADARGAGGVPLWTTEIGWQVGRRSYSGVPDARAQARELESFAAETERRREELRLGPSFAFALRDRTSAITGKVDDTSGLRGADDRPRPSWAVWSRAARAAPELRLPPARRCDE